jgi:hypothetical protein
MCYPSGMNAFETAARALEDLASAKDRGLRAAAERIEAKLKADATSRIGKVPDGISVTATATGISVDAPEWVLAKAQEKGQPAEWRAIVQEELEKASR